MALALGDREQRALERCIATGLKGVSAELSLSKAAEKEASALLEAFLEIPDVIVGFIRLLEGRELDRGLLAEWLSLSVRTRGVAGTPADVPGCEKLLAAFEDAFFTWALREDALRPIMVAASAARRREEGGDGVAAGASGSRGWPLPTRPLTG